MIAAATVAAAAADAVAATTMLPAIAVNDYHRKRWLYMLNEHTYNIHTLCISWQLKCQQ